MSRLDSIKNEILEKVSEYSLQSDVKKLFIPGETYIPASGKSVGEEERMLMVEASLDAWLTTGRFNDRFEKSLAEYLGIKFALTTVSGSAANLLAFTALTSDKLGEKRIKPGDEVITVAAGFPTTVNPIIQNNCIPVFVDVELGTYNVDVTQLEGAITNKTKAIMMAHTLGNPFNLKVVKELANKYDLWLIEDCCDALGSEYEGKKVGTFGDLATFSFYPAHQITMGEGGAVVCNSRKLYKIVESFRDWGRDCYCEPGQDNTCNRRFEQQLGELPFGYDHKYTYSHLGYNLKITDMQAACGVAQLEKLPGFVDKRRENFELLRSLLKNQKHLILPEPEEYSQPSWFGFPITVNTLNTSLSRLDILKVLEGRKIGTRLLFAGNLIKQPYFKDLNYRVHGELKNTDFIMNNTFWVGIHPSVTNEQINYMANIISDELA
ncbi:lipopolysaccharide biosynthesis protein RfbH [Catenovulum sp. SM1970]|uniref:lipopolysaccharide biosynthesis protein RfbH n=1 Tax=Marinifaba aquimaris TaxID=2741323 RepID=UPI0015739DDE|nr:lipopolysaccharide biosynthesis protein RfbH [Marinifaba aquimaris]NTS75352.1 lipopolysaccharide biosynthesis protein RfbH [Marinifaba aquimaris]